MKLQQVEHGQYSADSFMSEIEQSVREMCRKYGEVDKSVSSFSDGTHEIAGKCPKCGADISKGKFGWYCVGKCGMNVAKVYGYSLSDAQINSIQISLLKLQNFSVLLIHLSIRRSTL